MSYARTGVMLSRIRSTAGEIGWTIERMWPIFPQSDFHGAEKSSLGTNVLLLAPQPRTYHRHQNIGRRHCGTPAHHRRGWRGRGHGAVVRIVLGLQPAQR